MKIRIDTPIARLSADLPEDRVKDLLRIALEYATGGAGTVQRPVEADQPAPSPRHVDKYTPPTDIPEPVEYRRENGYKGFLYIKCEGCGVAKGFCAKAPIMESRCDCGHKTPLKDLKPLYLRCKCGAEFKYRTNITEPTISMSCIRCEAPVDLEYHEKKNVYTTIGQEEP